jgi:glutamate 5-kinase
MFTDNDELSGLIAGMMNAEVLLILSNVDGIYKGHPDDPGAELIREIQPRQELGQYISTDRSATGRGGMRTKYNIASKLAEEGIRVIIANGKIENIIPDLLSPKPRNNHSLFLPAEKTSAIKKWIAHSEGFAKGEVHINQGCALALMQNQASLLPVGIESVEGEFEKGDIVRVIDHEGHQIGVGKIRCDSKAARSLIGSKGQKALIHYDYLYLE